jgi:hypothetical protein
VAKACRVIGDDVFEIYQPLLIMRGDAYSLGKAMETQDERNKSVF